MEAEHTDIEAATTEPVLANEDAVGNDPPEDDPAMSDVSVNKTQSKRCDVSDNATVAEKKSTGRQTRKKLSTVLCRFSATEAPFECRTCSEQFQLQDELEKHAKTHTTGHSEDAVVDDPPMDDPAMLDVNDSKIQNEQHDVSDNATVAQKKSTGRQTRKKRSAALCHFSATGAPFKCRRCGEQFQLQEELRQHAKTHTTGQTNECLLCGKRFQYSGSLTTHMRVHTGEKPFTCMECGRQFAVSSHLKRHMMLHSGDRPYKCMYCLRDFIQLVNLKAHVASHFRDGKRRQNAIVDGTARDAAAAVKDEHASKSNKQKFTGTIGAATSTSGVDRLKNTSIIDTSDAGVQGMKMCGIVGDDGTGCGENVGKSKVHTSKDVKNSDFESNGTAMPSENKRAKKRTGGGVDKQAGCPFCGKHFALSCNLVAHLRIHTGEKPYVCKECGRRFSVSSHLKRHMITHSGDKPFTCMYCQKRFTQSGNLNVHMKLHSLKAEKSIHGCSECGKSYLHPRGLKVHMTTVHGRTLQHECTVCGSWFDDAAELKRHVQSHDDIEVNSFECIECGEQFDEPRFLTAHARKVHGPGRDKEMQLTCGLCSMSFSDANQLTEHSAIVHPKLLSDVHSDHTESVTYGSEEDTQRLSHRRKHVKFGTSPLDMELHNILYSGSSASLDDPNTSDVAGDVDVLEQGDHNTDAEADGDAANLPTAADEDNDVGGDDNDAGNGDEAYGGCSD